MGPPDDQSRRIFPIPAKAIAGEMLRRVYWSPATWLPIFLSLAVGFTSRSRIAFMAAGAATMIGVGVYWTSKWRSLVQDARLEVMLNRAQEQNRVLYRKSYAMRDQQCEEDADSLRRFIELKTVMDKAILRTGDLTPENRKTKLLVDTICFEVADELGRLSEIRQMLRKSDDHLSQDKRQSLEDKQSESAQRVESAYQSLATMHEQLGSMLTPGQTPVGSSSNLDAAITQAREEAEIARRVRERIEADNVASILSESPESGSDQTTSQRTAEED